MSELAKNLEARNVPVSLFIDEEPTVYVAAKVDAMRWNGWASPWFTLDVVKQIAADTVKDAERFGEDCDVIEVTDDGRVFHVQPSYGARDEVLPDAEGLYPVGAWCWCWNEV